jgi:signal peptidase I
MAAADSPPKTSAREYYEALLIAMIFVNFARIFVFQAFKIPTPSMEDNLKVGDHIIVNKFIYGPGSQDGPGSGEGGASLLPLRGVERGDVVVFRYPNDPDQDYVKRVIGLPGDVVSIRDKKVLVNGRELAEPYVLHVDPRTYPAGQYLPEPYRSRDQLADLRIRPGEFFVLGDNRDDSSDSRYWGTVPRRLIKGRAFMVYWSFEGTPARAGSPLRERLREIGDVVLNFFTKTRWHRSFYVIDSSHHYTPGVTSNGID